MNEMRIIDAALLSDAVSGNWSTSELLEREPDSELCIALKSCKPAQSTFELMTLRSCPENCDQHFLHLAVATR